MKKILVGFLFLLFSTTCLPFVQAADPFTGTITGDLTLNVPSEFININDAFDYLNNKNIAQGAIVTIQVADGSYTYSETISVKHRDGNKIIIKGNSENPSSCTITFTGGVNGLTVNLGSSLKEVNGFEFISQGNTGYHGIYVGNQSVAFLKNMIVDGFYGNNIVADRNSSIQILGNVTAKNGLNNGIGAFSASFIDASAATSTNNAINFTPPVNTAANDTSYIKY